MMKKVYICSPLGGNVKENLEQVKRYTKYALMCGTAPVVRISMRNVSMTVIQKKEKSDWRQGFPCCGFAMRCGCSVMSLPKE